LTNYYYHQMNLNRISLKNEIKLSHFGIAECGME